MGVLAFSAWAGGGDGAVTMILWLRALPFLQGAVPRHPLQPDGRGA